MCFSTPPVSPSSQRAGLDPRADVSFSRTLYSGQAKPSETIALAFPICYDGVAGGCHARRRRTTGTTDVPQTVRTARVSRPTEP